jgi:hypothetical protein
MAGQALTIHCDQCSMPAMVPVRFVGQKITCSRCGHKFVVLSASTKSVPLVTAPPPVQPPHLLKHAPAPPPIPAHLQTTRETNGTSAEANEEIPQGRSPLLLGCLLLTTFMGFGVVIFAIVMFADWFAQRQQKQEVAVTEETTQTEDDLRRSAVLKQKEDGFWTDATKRQYVHDGIAVRLDNVAIAPVRFQSGEELLETERNYLVVNLTVTNKTFERINYQSWYSYEFESEAGKIKASCFDERGDTFFIFPIPGADRVERHRYSEKPLDVRDETSDTLVFQLPLDYLQRPRTALYLKLPAAAVGKTGTFQLKVAPDMIVDRANVPNVPQPASAPSSEEFNPSEPPVSATPLDSPAMKTEETNNADSN